MEIVFYTHHAVASAQLRHKAELAVRKAARRAVRPVDAVIRFEQDGAVRRVELALHTARGRLYVARAEARFFGFALSDAARRLAAQLSNTKRSPKSLARRSSRRASERHADKPANRQAVFA